MGVRARSGAGDGSSNLAWMTAAAVLLFAAKPNSAYAQPDVGTGAPPHEWDIATGVTGKAFSCVDYGKLDRVFDAWFSDPIASQINPYALLVIYQGKIVGERYGAGKDASSPLPGNSMGKSVSSALAGIRVGDGALAMTDPATAPQWDAAEVERRGITLDDLNRMLAGLNETADKFAGLLNARDGPAFVGKLEQKYPAGSFWDYVTSNFVLLLYAIKNTFRDEGAYQDFPGSRLYNKLGASSLFLTSDGVGNFIPFALATARDYARFGQLYLQDGVWGGERLLPAGWVRYTVTPGSTAKGHEYGAGWWVNLWEGEGIVPPHTFYAYGFGGQYIVIMPSIHLLVVQLGSADDDDALTVVKHLYKDLVSAFPAASQHVPCNVDSDAGS